MPTPSVGKVIQYVPASAVDAVNGVDFTQIQAGLILQINPVILKIFGNDGRELIVPNAIEDDTQTAPNSYTWASQTT